MSEIDILKGNVDAFFLVVMGCFVFFMQCGFAFLEAGSVRYIWMYYASVFICNISSYVIWNWEIFNFRSKNTVNILTKNMVDSLLGGVSYWAVGWGLSHGRGSSMFVGESNFFSHNIDPEIYPLWFFQFVFAATAATILSGSICERVGFFSYFVYSIVFTGKCIVREQDIIVCWDFPFNYAHD